MKRPLCCVGVLVVLGVQTVFAQELVQGPYGPNGTWNIYELGEEFLTWAEALEVSRSRTREGVQGDLASIHSLEENQVIADLAFNQIVWIGATDREGTAPQLEQNGHLSPQESIELELGEFLGAENVEAAKFAGWAWTNGDPFCFQNWGGGEPNNWDGAAAGPADTGREDATFIREDSFWNDAPGGYDQDEPVPATLQPGTSTQEVDDGANIRLYDFVIEYRTNSPTPFPGITQDGDEAILEPDCGPNEVDPTLPGDFNQNGELDAPDIDDLTGQSAAGANNVAYDLDGDALVNSADVNHWIDNLYNSWVGDANLDRQFNSSDLVTVLASGTYEVDVDSFWTSGDFNGDGRTNSSDLVAALAGGGYELGPRAVMAAVPEPTAAVLWIISLLGLRFKYSRSR